MSTLDIQQTAKTFDLASRLTSIKTIPGTRSHHSFTPSDSNSIEMRRLSADTVFITIVLTDHVPTDFDVYQPGKYAACIYDSNWYVGNIVETE